MPESPARAVQSQQSVAVDASGTIIENLACGMCGYNLRGQPVESKCTECGTEIARSLRNDLLRYSDPNWVASIAFGFVPLMICTALSWAVQIAGAIANRFLLNSMASPQQFERIYNWMVAGSLITALITQFLMLWGIWLLTRNEPGRVMVPTWLRPAARFAFSIAAALMIMQWLPWLLRWLLGGFYYIQETVVVSRFLALAMLIVGAAAMFALARRLARRVPDEQLARRTAAAAIGILCIWLAGALFRYTDWFSLIGQISGPASLYVVHIPHTIVTIWAMVLLMQYRRAIRGAIKK